MRNLDKRLSLIEERIATLEAGRVAVSWREGVRFPRGQMVRHNGAFWLAARDTESESPLPPEERADA
jgi:hypothetical protein